MQASLSWGSAQLVRVQYERHLAVRMREGCSWDEQLAAALKGRGAIYVWMRALRSPWLKLKL